MTEDMMTPIERAICLPKVDYGKATDVINLLSIKLLHLESSLMIATRHAHEAFSDWSPEIRDGHLHGCAFLAAVVAFNYGEVVPQ